MQVRLVTLLHLLGSCALGHESIVVHALVPDVDEILVEQPPLDAVILAKLVFEQLNRLYLGTYRLFKGSQSLP